MPTPEQFEKIAQNIKDKAQEMSCKFQVQMKTETFQKVDEVTENISETLESESEDFDEAEEIFTDYLEKMGLACWIEIITESPECIYYFGPFAGGYEAQQSVQGYWDDLQAENAQIVSLDIRRGIPRELTIREEEMEKYFVNSEFSSFVSAWLGV
ncbi:MAG: DUF1816 domain-containing protein [Limnoraphis robusta]|jgi:radical SAM superfamily enzyme|uniref:DUF1816 domain-containing protein n=1 Tax=Limnoraphis robusta CCNP1315 TaxID=3110306 RepID=A0ABU5U232_9CYAN|nr:DUF1816 domain-containing protein [Limnoraphis robusta]MEA5501385.1 DUF1816 domain-containing protein [Limnoraphis robusta BA-68 BA1]MEA5521257.1 DUF1816 domain-containing protein [Limnoraphis robusta CCNP1315]